jgi:hypothetical protein
MLALRRRNLVEEDTIFRKKFEALWTEILCFPIVCIFLVDASYSTADLIVNACDSKIRTRLLQGTANRLWSLNVKEM